MHIPVLGADLLPAPRGSGNCASNSRWRQPRAAIATFLARLASPQVSWVDEHLLLIAGRSPATTENPAVWPARRTR
jgi:hypothetical protein